MVRLFTAVLSLAILSVSLHAATFQGTQLTGAAYLPPSTVNQFDPNTMAEPSYCQNTSSTTVTIQVQNPNLYQFCAIYTPAGSGTGAAPATAIVAQLFDYSLVIQVGLGTRPDWTPFQLTLTDSAFAGVQIAKDTDDFLCTPTGTCGVNATLSGTTVTITGSVSPGGGVYNAVFTLTPPGFTNPVVAPLNFTAGFSAPTITWNPVPGADFYTVIASTGNVNVFNSWQIPANVTSYTLPVSLLPPFNSIALWAHVNGNWSFVGGSSYNPATANLIGSQSMVPGYLGAVGWSDFIYPLNGATNVDPFNPFTWVSWTGGPNQDGSNLIIGTSPGASDVFNSGTIQDTQTIPPYITGGTLQVPALQSNTKYYARLTGPGTFITPRDISFTTGVGQAHLTFPVDEAQQVDVTNPVALTCNSVSGALQYVLWLGSTPGGNDILAGWPGLATSATIQLYPNIIYYARMWTEEANGQWVYVDSRFSTFPTDVAFASFPRNGDQFASALTVAQLGFLGAVTPVLDVGWKVIPDATGYTLWIGTSPGGNDVLNTYQFIVSGNVAYAPLKNPVNNTTYYLRLWTQKGTQWYFTDSVIATNPQNPVNQYGGNAI